MKGFIWKMILFMVLSIFLYRQRHYLFRLFLGVEVLRRLGTSLSFKWLDMRDWIRHHQHDEEWDHA